MKSASLYAQLSLAHFSHHRAHSPLALAGLAAAAWLTTTCGSPTRPSRTIIIPPPTVTCPVSPAPVPTTNGQSAVATYSPATVTGGTAPVSVSCTPASGSTFALGSTPVTCTATDVVRRTASCSFTVTVILPPRLGVTTILAFGDSITEGEVPVVGEFAIRPHYVQAGSAYPADLATELAQRYTEQGASRIDAFAIGPTNLGDDCTNTNPPRPTTSGIVVINAGCLGEPAESSTQCAQARTCARDRLIAKIAIYHPDLVLLLEGTNDLSADPLRASASISAGVMGVQGLIAAAQSSGARVLVGTLLPQIAADLTHGGAPDQVVPFNARLVPAVLSSGASIVDLYSDIVQDQTDWISPYDGLHPTEAGYQEIARVWFTSIQRAFELASTTTSVRSPGMRIPARRK